MANLNDYMKVRDVAKAMDRRKETIMRYIHEGTLQAVKVGNRFYIHKDEVDKYLDIPK